ncbi:type II toxin-antitoxin system PemK/MazF family toxin [Patescibacteria group bacterium]|nr:type II toxin-antitoxin system PemK/MazF family toxin [Patescibacteria group bacterium]MBU1721499.1 type II toxin-antitoxin system PemK/MazF family toxin [Patescibacteria group bacterium]MBU1900929.1 type II toxin-antitoxin system PemK/MazF family toxin [Patescibacteria group bacterium]
MKQGEIWLVCFPKGTGHEYFKERPALIVESNSQLHLTSLVTIMPITSNVCVLEDIDFLIQKDAMNNLHRESVIKTGHLTGFDKSRFLKKIGKVDPVILVEVKKYLQIHFDI